MTDAKSGAYLTITGADQRRMITGKFHSETVKRTRRLRARRRDSAAQIIFIRMPFASRDIAFPKLLIIRAAWDFASRKLFISASPVGDRAREAYILCESL